MKNIFSLEGKTALVTGGNRGLGYALSLGLARAGANIIAMARNFEGSGISEAVETCGTRFSAVNCDLADRKQLYRHLKDIDISSIDILINNAGMIARQPAADHSDEYWDSVMAVNLDAQFIITREIGRAMIARGSGKIVFICSMLSYQGGINVPGYTASKSAVAGLVRAFANEWAAKGVNVNGIAPGYMSTDNTKALREDPDRNAAILSRIPAGRWGNPNDIAGAAVFLSSSAADYVHGAILNVDGGWMAR